MLHRRQCDDNDAPPPRPQLQDGVVGVAGTLPPMSQCGCPKSALPQRRSQPTLRLLSEAGSNPPALASVVVTINDGDTYDDLFGTVPQKGPEGTRVAVYKCGFGDLPSILPTLRGDGEGALEEEATPALAALRADVESVEASSVVFNWECCSGCSDRGFPEGHAESVLELMEELLARGSMVMCSDFALKALIANWQVDLLGPNPFVKVGGFNGNFKLHFDKATLASCPSAQLQKVGELADKTSLDVAAQSDTICFCVDQSKTAHSAYELEVLTVATDLGALNLEEVCSKQLLCSVNGIQGAAGHVLLKYPTGGMLLTSCGHWLELMRLDVSLETLLQVSGNCYGRSYSTQIFEDVQSASNAVEKKAKLQRYASMIVQQSSPSAYAPSPARRSM